MYSFFYDTPVVNNSSKVNDAATVDNHICVDDRMREDTSRSGSQWNPGILLDISHHYKLVQIHLS